MDRGKKLCAAALLGLTACWGCTQSGPTDLGADQAPDRVVADFLEAVRVGDDKKAADLLTPLAREKTSEVEMVVAPPGSETASFQVGQVSHTANRAQVESDWTDLDSDGRRHTDRIVWLLRQVADGWRIAGMTTQVFEDQPAVVLNFEDPAEMVRQQQQAEEEIARRERDQFKRIKTTSAVAPAPIPR